MTAQKHIVFVSNTAYSMWNFRRDVLADLLASGYGVTCMAADDGYADKLRAIGVHFVALSISRSGLNPLKELLMIGALWRALHTARPHLIITYTIKPNSYVPLLARILRVPCLAVVTGLGYAFLQNTPAARVARTVLKTGLRFARKIWFLNADDAAVIAGGLPAHKTAILPGEGIDISYFDGALYPTLPDTPFTFLMIARLLRDKGVLEYAEAAKMVWANHPNTRFQILGSLDAGNPAGIAADNFKKLCLESGLEYLGSMADVRPAIAAAHVVVLPSYREGIPFALLEGAAMCRPLIATDVAGCRDVVRDGQNGYIVRVQSALDLATAMTRMRGLPGDEFRAMKDFARADVAARFGKDIVMNRYHQIVEELMEIRK